MASDGLRRITELGLAILALGAGGYWLSLPEPTPQVVGVVRTTEVRVEKSKVFHTSPSEIRT